MAHSEKGASRPVSSIVALIIGIIAIVMSWMPFINNLAFVFGAIGLIFGIVGLVGVLRGKRSGKVLAIVALVINVVSLVVVFGTQSIYSAAIDDALDGSEVTGVSQGSADDDTDEADVTDDDADATDDGTYTDLAVGTTVELENGLSVTVESVETDLVNFDDSTVVGVYVTYENNGDEAATYNPYDWMGEDSQGAQEYSTYYSEATDELNSGNLAAGGTVSGWIYFESDTVKALYFGDALSDEPTASWTLS